MARCRICVFCSTQNGNLSSGPEAARQLARIMQERDIELIYGGGSTGLMGELARERVRIGGTDDVLGVIPYALVKSEREGRGQTKKDLAFYAGFHSSQAQGVRGSSSSEQAPKATLFAKIKRIFMKLGFSSSPNPTSTSREASVVSKRQAGHGDKPDPSPPQEEQPSLDCFGEDAVVLPTDKDYGRAVGTPLLSHRKALMIDLVAKGGNGSGFIGLPGGFGSLDEIMEVVTSHQMGIHQQLMVLVNLDGFWDGLETWMDGAVSKGFLKAESRDMVKIVSGVSEAIDILMPQDESRKFEEVSDLAQIL